MQPRFIIDRKTKEVNINKPLTGSEVQKLQEAVLIRQIELHPELLKKE